MSKNIENEDVRRENITVPSEAEFKRKRLLARVAGHVAAGLLVSPSPKVNDAEKMATVAVDVAEAILCKAGL